MLAVINLSETTWLGPLELLAGPYRVKADTDAPCRGKTSSPDLFCFHFLSSFSTGVGVGGWFGWMFVLIAQR